MYHRIFARIKCNNILKAHRRNASLKVSIQYILTRIRWQGTTKVSTNFLVTPKMKDGEGTAREVTCKSAIYNAKEDI